MSTINYLLGVLAGSVVLFLELLGTMPSDKALFIMIVCCWLLLIANYQRQNEG
jgi:hypothetical protein